MKETKNKQQEKNRIQGNIWVHWRQKDSWLWDDLTALEAYGRHKNLLFDAILEICDVMDIFSNSKKKLLKYLAHYHQVPVSPGCKNSHPRLRRGHFGDIHQSLALYRSSTCGDSGPENQVSRWKSLAKVPQTTNHKRLIKWVTCMGTG